MKTLITALLLSATTLSATAAPVDRYGYTLPPSMQKKKKPAATKKKAVPAIDYVGEYVNFGDWKEVRAFLDDVAARDGLWMSPADAAEVTGWTLKPEGMCRDDLCVPLPASAVGINEVDLAAFWKKLGGPVVSSETRDVWALGAPP